MPSLNSVSLPHLRRRARACRQPLEVRFYRNWNRVAGRDGYVLTDALRNRVIAGPLEADELRAFLIAHLRGGRMNRLAEHIRNALIECTAHRGFAPPLIITAVAVNGAVYSIRTDGTETEVLAAGTASRNFMLPINIMVVDATGEAARMLITPDGQGRIIN